MTKKIKVTKPDFLPETPVREAAFQMTRYYLDRAFRNEKGALAGEDSEFVHAMRVALRKLRSALRGLKLSMTERNYLNLTSSLKWLAEMLGPVRDMDVFLENYRSLLPSDENGDEIRQAVLDLRRMEMAEMLSAFRSRKYLGVKERLTSIEVKIFNRKDLLSISSLPIQGIAGKIILTYSRNVRKKAGKIAAAFDTAIDRDIHRLRIEIKRLRYSLENYSRLFQIDFKLYTEKTVELQRLLGNYVDTIFFRDLIPVLKERNTGGTMNMTLFEMEKNLIASRIEMKNNIRIVLNELIESQILGRLEHELAFYRGKE